MLSTYLADVEQLLDEQQWELALRDAYDLPRIAVALVDPGLTCSIDRCKAWCEEWIRPQLSAGDAATDSEHICLWLDRHAQTDVNGDFVPLNALRRLRLRRHARNAPRGFNSELLDSENPDAVDAVELCTAVVDGVRRWYAHSACRNPTAQANLARLAVLR
ncbi:MAG TPA: hypothetical protein VMT29_01250 [Steroidobacteraceae bacterium]|nr:hypothetical protein [Steroidobacteraceae bacterium]